MTRKHFAKFVVLVGLVFLVSCLSQEITSNQNTPTASPTANLAFTPTQTLYPSLATNIAYWATATVSIKATASARGVACPELYQLRNPENLIANSNDGWTVFTCSLGNVNLAQAQESFLFDTFVASVDGKQTWKISHDNPVWSNGKSVQLETYRWSVDRKYVYLIPVLKTGGSGVYPPGYFWDNYGLYRLNLITGLFENILPYSEKGYSFSLSPSDQYLAYSIFETTPVHIKNMVNDDEQLVALNEGYVLTGAFAWSGDSSSLMFASAVNGWQDGNGGVSIYKVTIKDYYLENILSNDKRLLVPFPAHDTNNYWSNENLLYVKSLNYLSYEYFSELALDVQLSNIIVLASPEPSLIGSPTPKP